MLRLKTTQVKPTRDDMLTKQGGRCAITHYPLPAEKAVLDHDHASGHVRAVLSRGANSLLGKLENNYKRYGLSLGELFALGRNLEAYMTRDYTTNPLHPTHKSEDEKRIRRNTLARKRRVIKKES